MIRICITICLIGMACGNGNDSTDQKYDEIIRYVYSISNNKTAQSDFHNDPKIQNNPCKEGECVARNQCANVSINDRTVLFDIRMDNEGAGTEIHSCKDSFEVCCIERHEPNALIPDIPEIKPLCEEGECILREHCANVLNTDGKGLIDIRMADEDHPSCGPPEVCCIKKFDNKVPLPESPPLSGINPCYKGECVPNYRCMNKENQSDQSPCPDPAEICCIKKFESNKECGIRNIKYGAQIGEFPWIVEILKSKTSNSRHIESNPLCGGSLVYPSVVLTAADCIYGNDPQDLIVRAGESKFFPYQDRAVAKCIIHRNYNTQSLFNDVALVFLTEAFTISPNVNIICTPPKNFNFDLKLCLTSNVVNVPLVKKERHQRIQKSFEVSVVPHSFCENNLRSGRMGTLFKLNERFICADGNSGSVIKRVNRGFPLVCPIPGTLDQYVQAGIVVWGIKYGRNNTTGVYANVPMFRNWIDENILASL